MDRALSWFIRAWIWLAVLVNVAAVAGFFGGALSFWDGWQRVADIYSPLNVINWIAEIVLVLPAFGAYMLLERRRKKGASQAKQVMSSQEAQQIINAYGAATETPAPWLTSYTLDPLRKILPHGR